MNALRACMAAVVGPAGSPYQGEPNRAFRQSADKEVDMCGAEEPRVSAGNARESFSRQCATHTPLLAAAEALGGCGTGEGWAPAGFALATTFADFEATAPAVR